MTTFPALHIAAFAMFQVTAGDTAPMDLQQPKRTCAAGEPASCYLVGRVYREGLGGVAKNLALARLYLQKSCDGGVGKACALVGQMYLEGTGVPKDLPRGQALMSRACTLGEASSCTPVPIPKAKPASATSDIRLGIWGLGYYLTLAAVTNAQDNPSAVQLRDKYLSRAKQLGAILQLPVPPLPARRNDKRGQPAADALDYVLGGPGKDIARLLRQKHVPQDVALFELAVRCQLLTLIYSPGDDLTITSRRAIEKFGPQSGLPGELWRPLTAKIEARASFAEIVTETEATSRRIGEHLRSTPSGPASRR